MFDQSTAVLGFIPLKTQHFSSLDPAGSAVSVVAHALIRWSQQHEVVHGISVGHALLQHLLPLPLNLASMVQETLDVFVPLANRLGVWTVKSQLEDLAFQILQVSLLLNFTSFSLSKRMLHWIDRQRSLV